MPATPITIADRLRTAHAAYLDALCAVEEALVVAIADDAVLGELVDAIGDLTPSGRRVGEVCAAIRRLDVIA
jgi:hypothetical protein